MRLQCGAPRTESRGCESPTERTSGGGSGDTWHRGPLLCTRAVPLLSCCTPVSFSSAISYPGALFWRMLLPLHLRQGLDAVRLAAWPTGQFRCEKGRFKTGAGSGGRGRAGSREKDFEVNFLAERGPCPLGTPMRNLDRFENKSVFLNLRSLWTLPVFRSLFNGSGCSRSVGCFRVGGAGDFAGVSVVSLVGILREDVSRSKRCVF